MSESNHFGDCPACGKNDGYLNIGQSHYFICEEHKKAWWVGKKLFSSWHEETQEDWDKNAQKLAEFEMVEPVYSPEWGRV